MKLFERTDMTIYKYATVGGRRIFYRQAGEKDAPTIVMLHGFPSSSHMFRDLIPLLTERYHLVATDFSGFGQSDMPGRRRTDFRRTFRNGKLAGKRSGKSAVSTRVQRSFGFTFCA